MSGKQSNSSKKSNSTNNIKNSEAKKKKEKSKPLKLRSTSKLGRKEVSRKLRDFKSRQGTKLIALQSKTKRKFKGFYDKIVHQEVYLDGQEPPKSYGGKKFLGLYAIFGVYSLFLITAINIPESTWIDFLMFGDAFAFSITIVAFFLILSVLFSIDKVRIFIFEEKTLIKQSILYLSLISSLYLLFLYISTDINFLTYLLTLAMIWLVLLSSRFYIYSRKFSTKIEARFIKKYSIPRYFFAIITPFFILGILVILSLLYRSFLVFLSLDFFGRTDPSSAVNVYNLEMRVVMPLIYFSLVMTLVFIIFEFVFTRRRAETKRAGTFDNFTFSLIVLFIFFFQILQISIFLLLQPDTVVALKATIGATGSPASYVFLFEFLISMYFLFRIIRKTGRTLGWRIMFFKKDGLILFCLACVFAQTLTRFSLASQIHNQIITDMGRFFMADKYFISVLMIFFLGSTLLIYYLKPHETSMFIRLQKETVGEEEKNMEKIYKIIRSEYIRRGEAFPIEIIERELIKATQLSKANVYSLLEQLVRKDMDILIREEKKEFGKPTKIIDFVSVTERFEKKEIAELKARKYLSERLFETSLADKSKTSRLKAEIKSDKATDRFIESLTTNYKKKHIDEQKIEEIKKEALVSDELKVKLTEDLRNQIINIIKKEYVYRIENPEKIPDFSIPISEIITRLEMNTKITIGELYSILENLSNIDLELALIENPDEPEDKKIKFFPFADNSISYSLANFRPLEYSKFRIVVTKNFLKALKSKKEKRILFQLKKEIPDQTENQRSWLELLSILHNFYPLYAEQLKFIPNKLKMIKQLDLIKKDFERKQSN